MKKKETKVLVTGAAGFIGTKLCIKLSEFGFTVIAVDDLSSGNIKNLPSKIKFYKLDLSKSKNINKIPKCKFILHLAGQSSGEKSFDSPTIDLKKNTITTLNLIKYGIKCKSKKIIYASSMSIYGNISADKISEMSHAAPMSCYGVSKLASEKYLQVFSNKLPYIIFRMFNVYGPGQNMKDLRQGMVSIYLSQLLNKNTVIVKGSLNRTRDFIHVEDVVNIWLISILKNIKNEIFNLGTGKPTKVRELLNKIFKLTGKKKIKILSSTNGDQIHSVSNNSKIIKTFKYKKFISLDEGLNKFYDEEIK
ncbi:NAD-dependent epimerase/dehydratase family protein [Candidatus Pelagibacter sp.]|nr:NAD-dependent epimerase/dehydratase family protein [Candidatus Pelagibacter sp.]